jgi:hypothetical protein
MRHKPLRAVVADRPAAHLDTDTFTLKWCFSSSFVQIMDCTSSSVTPAAFICPVPISTDGVLHRWRLLVPLPPPFGLSTPVSCRAHIIDAYDGPVIIVSFATSDSRTPRQAATTTRLPAPPVPVPPTVPSCYCGLLAAIAAWLPALT